MAPPMSEKDDLRQTLNFAHAVVLRAEAKVEIAHSKMCRESGVGTSEKAYDEVQETQAELHESKATLYELQAAWVEKFGPVFD